MCTPSKKAPSISESNQLPLTPPAAPRLLPVLLLVSAVLWIFTTTGGRQIFVKEILGGAYDSQAEHFLRGNVDVDADAIRHESMIVNGKVRMYFGPFPSFIRIPLNFVYPAGRGKWSRIAGFSAALIALFAFAGLVRMALCSSRWSLRARNWLGNACVVGFAFGSPLLLLLGNLSIYDEAVIWAFALSVAALFFASRAQEIFVCGSSRAGCAPENAQAPRDHALMFAVKFQGHAFAFRQAHSIQYFLGQRENYTVAGSKKPS